MNDKDAGMLEERIKRSSKQRPPSAALQAPLPQTKTSPSEEKPRKGKRRCVAITADRVWVDECVCSIVPEDMPQKMAPPQPAKRFLDLDDDEQTNYEMPKLIQMDLTDLLEEPIVLPTAK